MAKSLRPIPRLPGTYGLGCWFAKYAPGWPLLLTAGYLLGHANLVNPVLAGLDLVVLYLIGREVYARSVALLATVLALSSPLFLFLAATFLSHTAVLLYLSAFLYLMARWERRRNVEGHSWCGLGRWDPLLLAPAGFFLGMGMMTRQLDTIAFAFPFLVPLIARPLRLVLVALGAAGPMIVGLLYNQVLTGGLFTNAYTLAHSFDRVGFGPHVGKEGFTPGQGLWNISHDLELLQAHLFGWPYYVALAFALIPFVLGRARRWDVFFGASVLCVVGAYAFYFDPGDWYGLPRYYYVIILPLALLSARGVQELCRLGPQPSLSLPSRAVSGIAGPLLLITGLLFYNLRLYTPAQTATFSRWNSANLAALTSVRRAHVHNALVFQVQTPWSYWWPYAQVFSQNSPLLNGDIVYARDEGCADRHLMSLYPRRAYYRLDNTSLKRIAASCSRNVSLRNRQAQKIQHISLDGSHIVAMPSQHVQVRFPRHAVAGKI